MDQTKPVPTTTAAPDLPARRRFGLNIHLPELLSNLLQNRKARIGIIILLFFTLVGLFAPKLAPYSTTRTTGRPQDAPSAAHFMGTTRQGQDVLSQMIYGAQTTLLVGFLTGTNIMIIAVLMGLTAGYAGGWLDEILSLITNIFLILPGLPLVIVVAGWLEQPGPLTVVLVLSLTSWAYAARVLRSQTLILKNSEFVAAAKVVGEPTWRIILAEIFPNMISLVVSSWIGAVLYAILAEAGLEFIGLGNSNVITWGTILYWAQANQALLTGAWWTFIPPGVCIALIGLSLVLINYGIDEITNPRLQRQEAG